MIFGKTKTVGNHAIYPLGRNAMVFQNHRRSHYSGVESTRSWEEVMVSQELNGFHKLRCSLFRWMWNFEFNSNRGSPPHPNLGRASRTAVFFAGMYTCIFFSITGWGNSIVPMKGESMLKFSFLHRFTPTCGGYKGRCLHRHSNTKVLVRLYAGTALYLYCLRRYARDARAQIAQWHPSQTLVQLKLWRGDNMLPLVDITYRLLGERKKRFLRSKGFWGWFVRSCNTMTFVGWICPKLRLHR